MEVTRTIARSFADEHVIGCDPPLRPEQPGVWRRRMHPFAGRAVSDKALTAEQDVRSGLQRLYGLSRMAGTVTGLEVSAEPGAIGAAPAAARLRLTPGIALAASGEDISLGSARSVALAALPVILRADHQDALEADREPDVLTGSAPSGSRLPPALPRRIGRSLGEIADNARSAALPHAAVLVARPVTAIAQGREGDGCPPDARDDAYADLQRIDGTQLALYLWPGEITASDGGADYALPRHDKAQRNRLAYAVFDTEKLLGPGETHPWEQWGVPLALLGFEPDWSLDFVDRFAVVRSGGGAAPRTPLVPGAGEPRLWQARIDQFVHQLSEQPSFDERLVRDTFARMPPVGLLPHDLFDPILRRQFFFPGSYAISAVPVPQSNLDLACGEAAGLASFNRNAPDEVELLVPVPDTVYEPNLLQVEAEDPRFAATVAKFLADRARWLATREAGRRRLDRLSEAVTGRPGAWPATDLPTVENCPDPAGEAPVEVTRTRVVAAGSSVRVHALTGAGTSLPMAATDTLWLWLRIVDPAGLTGIALRLASGTDRTSPSPGYGAGVFWGGVEQLAIGTAGFAANRIGDLPRAGEWVRLDIPASRAWTADRKPLTLAVNAVELSQRGGTIEWGALGRTDANGRVTTFIGSDAPAGAALWSSDAAGRSNPGWPWVAVAGRDALDVPDFGTVEQDGVRRAAAFDAFRAEWSQAFLAADIRQIDELGIDAFLAAIKQRLDVTNDAVDLAFVRARADIYRVRQYMLGSDAASRLVTSPSLADLAVRDESARTTAEGINVFLDRIAQKADAVTPTPSPSSGSRSGGAGASAAGTGQSSIAMLNLATAFAPTFMTLNASAAASSSKSASAKEAARAGTSVRAIAAETRVADVSSATTMLPLASGVASFPAAGGLALGMPSGFVTPITMLPVPAATVAPIGSLGIAAGQLTSNRYVPVDIRAQQPIAGLVERTLSVAERLKPSPARQALDYALASKAAVVAALSKLLGTAGRPGPGIALDDLPMPGFQPRGLSDEQKEALPPTAAPMLSSLLADMRQSGTRAYEDADKLPEGKADTHESLYFTAAVRAIDNAIAIMRLVEGRIALYERLRTALDTMRDEVLGTAREAAAWLRRVDVEVEEARHDCAVAAQLRAEEAARVAATNARRLAVLQTHAGVVAWRRVRESDHRDAVPLLELASGLAPDPVVACQHAHDDVPDEIHDYVELLRDAPVRWFPRIAAEVARIDRLEAARAAIEAMRYRAMLPVLASRLDASTKLLRGVQQAFQVQQQIVAERRLLVSGIDLARLASLSLAQTHVQIRETASLGDLADGRHRQPALTRMAGEEIAGIGQMAGCLHAAFAEVAPAIRLGWAEILSEFDRPAPLRTLSGLPGWPEVPIAERRTLQGFVDWLFARIDPAQAQASDAINELVRVALLMAAHAPVDQVIPARLVAPAAAQPGTRFQLALDVARVRKGMVALIHDRDDRVVSRAVIDDVLDGHAIALVTHNPGGIAMLAADLRIQLVPGV